MFNLGDLSVVQSPFPYGVSSNILASSQFEALRAEYPPLSRSAGWSRMSAELMRGDEGYSKLIENSRSWGEFHDRVHSRDFVLSIIDILRDGLKAENCKLDLDRAEFVDYAEGRDLFKMKDMPSAPDDHRLFCRMDLGFGEAGYNRKPHLDLRHRLASLLVYFDDADEQDMIGGNFNVLKKSGGDYETIKSVRPTKNLGILKIDSNNSYHSVDQIESTSSPRRTVFIAISGFRDMW